jgi:flagellar hook-length control protein FliK
MNASLPVLPIATDSAGGFPGLDTEVQGLQSVNTGQTGFAPVLEQAHAAVTADLAIAPLSTMDAKSLLGRVQSLPQAGKLLPLLEQVLDKASAHGVEPRELVQQIAEKLQQPGSTSELNPAASLVAALQQLVDEIPVLKTPAVADALARLSVEAKPSEVRLPNGRSTGQSLTQLAPRPAAVADVAEKPPLNAAQTEFSSNRLDRPLEQARPGQPEPRQAEMASLMAAVKRLTPQSKSVAADTPLRAESVMAAVTSQPAQVAQAAGPTTSALATLSVNTPLAQSNWDQALGERIQWMVNQKMQAAQLRLNPAQLGPMEVRIQVQNDQASIQFTSAHGVVREALEAALPRLRDMFDASGVELVDVDVSGQSFAGGQRPRGEDGAETGGMLSIDGTGETETVLETAVSSLLENGRLDLFA